MLQMIDYENYAIAIYESNARASDVKHRAWQYLTSDERSHYRGIAKKLADEGALWRYNNV